MDASGHARSSCWSRHLLPWGLNPYTASRPLIVLDWTAMAIMGATAMAKFRLSASKCKHDLRIL